MWHVGIFLEVQKFQQSVTRLSVTYKTMAAGTIFFISLNKVTQPVII